MPSILRILDFDKTISIEHTVRDPTLYHPDSNTKSGLQKTVVHNDEEICTIATFHKDPNYVLSYLLPVLGLTENDIDFCEPQLFEHHQLLKVYLKNYKYPLIISTPRTDDYETHLRALAWTGKNTQIRDIIGQLPCCDEYHFYDDTEKNHSTAAMLGTLYCHWVKEDKAEFTISKTSQPTALGELQNTLKAYLSRNRDEEKTAQPLHALSLFASSSDNNNNNNYQQEEEDIVVETLALIKNPQISAATALLKFLDSGPALNNAELTQLREGTLAVFLSNWEQKTDCSLMDFISTLVEKRAEIAVDYVSDDENYESCPASKTKYFP